MTTPKCAAATGATLALLFTVVAVGPNDLLRSYWPPTHVSAQVRDAGAPAPTGTAVISGTVVSADDSHRPIRRASVSVAGEDLRWPRVTSTDDSGHFQITSLTPGAYSATVSKPGFVSTYYGSRRPGQPPGTPFLLGDGERRDLTIPLMHGAVVTGVVTDTFGQPVPNIRVSVLEVRTVNGERRFVNVAFSGPNGGLTDEQGRYRIWGLSPGMFVIAANPNGPAMNQAVRQITEADLDWARLQLSTAGRASSAPAPDSGHTVGYTTVYFPGVVDLASATEVTLEPGLERGGLDFPLILVPTATISGTVLGLDGQPITSGAQVVLTTTRAALGGALPVNQTSSRGVSIDRSGKFAIPGVPPGEYSLSARTDRPAPPGLRTMTLSFNAMPPPSAVVPGSDLWASMQLDVAGDDIGGLVLTLRPGMTVSGHVVFQGTSTPITDLSRVRVGLNVLANDGVAASTPARPSAADGAFTVTGVTPGRYRPTTNIAPLPGPAGGPTATGAAGQTPWRLKSALWQGQDLLDVPLEVRPNEDITGVTLVFTDLTTELSGSLLSGVGAPATGYIVVVFPTNSSLWLPNGRRIRQTRPDAKGTYEVQNLPAGEYYLGAVTELDPGDLSDPSFLQQLAVASLKVTVIEGGTTVQNLRLKDVGGSRYDLRK